MNSRPTWWRWLTSPNPAASQQEKVVKLAVRVLLFVLLATLVSAALQMTPLGPALQTWWGSMLLVLVLYIPLARFMALDNPLLPAARPQRGAGATRSTVPTSALEKRRAKRKFAGTSKRPPNMGRR